MTGQDLIREAARRYPIGSRFVDLVHGETFTVKSHSFDSFGTDGQLYIPVEQHPVKPNKTARIYRSGKWAEVVDADVADKIKSAQKSKMETIQEECKKRFPIGCEYVCANSGSRLTLLSDAATYSIDDEEIWAHSGGGYLYSDGKFARHVGGVVPKTSMKEIQEECKKRFPIGCKYSSEGREYRILVEDTLTYSMHINQIWAHNGGGYLYKDGKYAEVISAQKPVDSTNPHMKPIQDECKKRFPIGCEYIGVGAGQHSLLSDDYTYSIHGDDIWAHSGGGVLYQEGEYAQFVSHPNFVSPPAPEPSKVELFPKEKVDDLSSFYTTSATTKKIKELSFRRIGAKNSSKVHLDSLIQEVSFRRIKSSK